MTTPNKPAEKATIATANDLKRAEAESIMATDIIQRKIQSELSPTKKIYLALGQDGKPKGFRAEFAFQVNMRRYLALQCLASGGNTRLSNIITFTSAGSDVDALAVPASMYVRETWGRDGTKILHMVENAMRGTETNTVAATLTNGNQIFIAVEKDHLLLRIKGARTSFPKIIEQVCWMVSVAGETSASRLANLVKETKQGTTTRGYSETIHTGRPVIVAGKGCRFHVSFSAARIEKHKNQDLVRRSGHCWKTMTELSIIATGFEIPSRPRKGSGLEAPLFVLRQLFKRSCPGMLPLALDNPMVIFPPSQVSRADKSGKVAQAYKVRLILAADSERPLRKRGNIIYWHFDPSKMCASARSIQQIEEEISVNPWAVDLSSRHFVGWSKDAGHLTTAPNDIPLGGFCNLTPRGHYQLVIPAATASLRADPAGSVGFSLAVEEVSTSSDTKEMRAKRNAALSAVRACVFVLFDTDLKRGWLVSGDTVALHLLRVHLKTDGDSNEFDFSSLKILGHDKTSAYSVLQEFNVKKESLNHLKDIQKKPENSESEQPAETKEEAIKEVIGGKLDGIYAVLLQLSQDARTINKRGGLSGPVLKWYESKWGTTLRGWDFNQLTRLTEAQIYVYKMHRDPGWLPLAEELNAAFLFANGLGEVLEPRAGSCCPYFPTLPTGKNFLACDMKLVEQLIEQYGGVEKNNPPDKIVARLSRSRGWERRQHPFARPNCQGDHLDSLGPSCFPIQSTQHAPYDSDLDKRLAKDAKMIKKLYTKGEVQAMIKSHRNGVVVFGHQPGSEELKDMYRRMQQNRQPRTQNATKAAPTVAQPSSRPSSRGSTQASNGRAAAAGGPELTTQSGAHSAGPGTTGSSPAATASHHKTVTQELRTGPQGRTPSMKSDRSAASALEATGAGKARVAQPSTTSAQRTPSTSSVRSTASSTHPKAASTAAGAEQYRTSSPRPLASSTHKTASNASLRSTDSPTRPKVTVAGPSRSHESTAEPNIATAARKPSSSSMRTTSSVASKAAGVPNPSNPTGQQSAMGLKKTATNSSDKTTSSHSSRSTQGSTAGVTDANGRQRQQRLDQLGPVTAAAGGTESHHSTSSGPAPASGSGPDGSS